MKRNLYLCFYSYLEVHYLLLCTNHLYSLFYFFYFRGEDSLKEYLEVKTVTIKMPYKI